VDGIADTIDCGSESDVANIDLNLDVTGLCEQVTQPPANPPGGGQGAQGGQGTQQKKKKCKKGRKLKKGKCVKKRKRKRRSG
jgi:hypothetical protein